MQVKSLRTLRGFTLIEMLFVMIIVSMMIALGMGYLQQRTATLRIDRTSMQMQQILNAGLSYYVSNSMWPTSLGCLQGDGSTDSCKQSYLPATVKSPWGQDYTVVSTKSNFYVYTPVVTSNAATSSANAMVIAGKLPLSYTTQEVKETPPLQKECKDTTCYVVASVNVPGQNLNNATAVNYAGIYHNGACVPAPACPVDKDGNTMTPKILVVPVSVSGVNDAPPNQANVYPISSFTAYTTPLTDVTPTSGPAACQTNTSPSPDTACYSDKQRGTAIESGKYWRVCLQVVTQRGIVNWGDDTSSENWGQYATILAMTRCEPGGEANASGSSFDVWAP